MNACSPFASTAPVVPDSIEQVVDPDGSTWETFGFLDLNDDTFTLQRRWRMLPSDVVKRKVEELVRVVEANTGRRASKRDRADIKMEAEAMLLPRALIKHKEVRVTFRNGRMYIWSSSKKLIDLAITWCVTTLGVVVSPIQTVDVAGWLTDLLGSDHLGDKAVLENGDGKIRVANVSVDAGHISRHIEQDGYRIVQAELVDGYTLKAGPVFTSLAFESDDAGILLAVALVDKVLGQLSVDEEL